MPVASNTPESSKYLTMRKCGVSSSIGVIVFCTAASPVFFPEQNDEFASVVQVSPSVVTLIAETAMSVRMPSAHCVQRRTSARFCASWKVQVSVELSETSQRAFDSLFQLLESSCVGIAPSVRHAVLVA